MSYFVYMLISQHNNKFYSYVGYTNDLKKRLVDHNNSKGAKYTKGRIWNIIYKKKNSLLDLKLSYSFWIVFVRYNGINGG